MVWGIWLHIWVLGPLGFVVCWWMIAVGILDPQAGSVKNDCLTTSGFWPGSREMLWTLENVAPIVDANTQLLRFGACKVFNLNVLWFRKFSIRM